MPIYIFYQFVQNVKFTFFKKPKLKFLGIDFLSKYDIIKKNFIKSGVKVEK